MGVIERLAVAWEDGSFAVVAALAWLSAALVSCPQVSVGCVSIADVAITAALPLLGPIEVSIEDDDREFEDNLEMCGLQCAGLASFPSSPLSQVSPPRSVSLSVLIPAQHPLRC
jgi:hypothetical protein